MIDWQPINTYDRKTGQALFFYPVKMNNHGQVALGELIDYGLPYASREPTLWAPVTWPSKEQRESPVKMAVCNHAWMFDSFVSFENGAGEVYRCTKCQAVKTGDEEGEEE